MVRPVGMRATKQVSQGATGSTNQQNIKAQIARIQKQLKTATGEAKASLETQLKNWQRLLPSA